MEFCTVHRLDRFPTFPAALCESIVSAVSRSEGFVSLPTGFAMPSRCSCETTRILTGDQVAAGGSVQLLLVPSPPPKVCVSLRAHVRLSTWFLRTLADGPTAGKISLVLPLIGVNSSILSWNLPLWIADSWRPCHIFYDRSAGARSLTRDAQKRLPVI